MAGLSFRALSPSLAIDRGHQQGGTAIRAPTLKAYRRGLPAAQPGQRPGGVLPPHQPQKLRRRAEQWVISKEGLWKPCESGCSRSPWGGWPGHPSQLLPPPDSGCLTSARQPHPTLGGPRWLDSRPVTPANCPLPGVILEALVRDPSVFPTSCVPPKQPLVLGDTPRAVNSLGRGSVPKGW